MGRRRSAAAAAPAIPREVANALLVDVIFATGPHLPDPYDQSLPIVRLFGVRFGCSSNPWLGGPGGLWNVTRGRARRCVLLVEGTQILDVGGKVVATVDDLEFSSAPAAASRTRRATANR